MRLPPSDVEISRVGMLMAGFRKKCGGNASGGVRVWFRVLSFSAEEPEGSVFFYDSQLYVKAIGVSPATVVLHISRRYPW